MVGVDYRVNTFHHVVEVSTGAPCLGRRTRALPVILPDGRRVEGRTWSWRDGACPLTGKVLYAADMEKRGLQRRVRVGNSRLTLFRLRDCYQVAAELLARGTDDAPPCCACPVRPEVGPETVPSDWDDERQCLRPDSAAWSY